MNFSIRLKELREQKGLSQAQLAKELNVGIGSVGMWESTLRTPPAKRLQAIANYFGVSVDYLLGRDGIITDEDRANGWADTIKISIKPIEGKMLEVFREIGERYGKETQEAAIAMLEKML